MTPRLRRQLRAAPELLELRLLAAALEVLLIALLFHHPTLDEWAKPTDPPTLRAARRLALRARALRASMRSYRAALRRLLRAPPAVADDLLF
jgi:hypothetical protein